MKRFVAVAVALVACLGLVLAATSCKKADANEIVVGHYASLTGNEASFGKATDNGIKLAIKEKNAAGGIKGKKIRLVTLDTSGKTQEAQTAVTRLITNEKVVAVLGEVASSRSLAGAPVAQRLGVPMITPSSTNPDVTKVGDMIFRVCFIDPFQGSVCAKFAIERGWKKAAVMYDRGQAYSVGLYENFEKSYKKSGGEVAVVQAFKSGESEFGAQLAAIKSSNPDVIFLPAYYTETASIIRAARAAGITAPFLGGDGWTSILDTKAGAVLDGNFYSDHYSTDDKDNKELQSFVERYTKEYGVAPDSMAALGYDAAMVLFVAMEKSPSLEGKDLAAAIAATKNHPGVTGSITIDADRNASKPAVVLEIKNGKLEYVRTIKPE